MTLRSEQDLQSHPCAYKLKDYEKPTPATGETQKVKKILPKLDENGNQVYREVVIKKGCGCKNKKHDGHQAQTTQTQKIPETIEVWVDEPVKPDAQKLVLCKLFGSVTKEHCMNCKTYKVKP